MADGATRARFVTTSWDDGHRADLQIAKLLHKRGIGGTFYVPLMPYRGQDVLEPAELRELSAQGFEVGAHSVSHQNLSGLSGQALTDEVAPCKPFLEEILGREVRMFCYPGGRYSRDVLQALKAAGYRGARTVRMLATSLDSGPFEMAVSLQAYPHSTLSYLKNVGRGRKPESLKNGWKHRGALANWLELGKKLFDEVMLKGGVWHLYGHSWEIDQLGLWAELEEMVDYVGLRKEAAYVCNGDLLDTAR